MTTTDAVFAHHGQQNLLKVSDVCKRLQMGKSKVFELIARGELESLKIDGARRFTEEQLQRFIARQVAGAKVSA